MRDLHSMCVAVALAACVAGCGSPAPPPAPAPTPGKRVDAATAAAIAGRVVFAGTPPARAIIRMQADPACGAATGGQMTDDALLVAKDGALQNVFVYVKDPLAEYSFDVPATPVVLDQVDCRYQPRVFGVRAGQPLDVVNQDDTLHNVHAIPMNNQEFNKGEPTKGSRMRQTFTVPEVMVRVLCNVHAWMHAYAGVMAHPFFAVTGADGAFALRGLPPGTYTVEAWHEQLGTTSQSVTVGPKQTQTIAFTLSFANAAKK